MSSRLSRGQGHTRHTDAHRNEPRRALHPSDRRARATAGSAAEWASHSSGRGERGSAKRGHEGNTKLFYTRVSAETVCPAHPATPFTTPARNSCVRSGPLAGEGTGGRGRQYQALQVPLGPARGAVGRGASPGRATRSLRAARPPGAASGRAAGRSSAGPGRVRAVESDVGTGTRGDQVPPPPGPAAEWAARGQETDARGSTVPGRGATRVLKPIPTT